MKLKNLLANKNVVTILGAVLIVVVLFAFYKWRVNQAINPISVPYAKVAIGPRTQITNDMIDYVEVQQGALKGSVLINAERDIINMYTNINTTIPEGGFFYKDLIVSFENLADSFLIDMPKDSEGNYMTAYNFGVNVETTYGNSIYPGNYVDIYYRVVEGDKVLYGKLASNVKTLAVKDASGNHVFENITENRTPSQIILAVTEELSSLLRVAESISESDLILVPTNIIYRPDYESTKDTIVTAVSDEDIKGYIEQRAA